MTHSIDHKTHTTDNDRPTGTVGQAKAPSENIDVVINGEQITLDKGATVEDALVKVGITSESTGVAIAVDAEVVPRSLWQTTKIESNARLEILRATQGG